MRLPKVHSVRRPGALLCAYKGPRLFAPCMLDLKYKER